MERTENQRLSLEGNGRAKFKFPEISIDKIVTNDIHKYDHIEGRRS